LPLPVAGSCWWWPCPRLPPPPTSFITGVGYIVFGCCRFGG
jgi:hypothetical protein